MSKISPKQRVEQLYEWMQANGINVKKRKNATTQGKFSKGNYYKAKRK